ncbi:MAG: PCMD domain-containing protein [Prevotella sp.]|nr:PCMD domain-containing protein [Prevotella sp.]
MKKINILMMAALALLSSCIKDEPLNQECDITSAWLEGDQYAVNFYQPSQMRQDNISTSEKEIVFTVKSLLSLPDMLPVHFDLTPGATMVPANGSEQNFKNGPVTYTVTSEDGAWSRQYAVVFKEASLPSNKFSFEHVETVAGINWNYYHDFYELDAQGNRLNFWASGNPGAIMTKSNSTAETQPTFSTEDGYVGKGVCMNTQSAGPLGEWIGKPIAAGNLFIGRFVVEKVLQDALKTTEFGRPFNRVPTRVTGYYKYKPGDEFTILDENKKKVTVPGRVDEASIYAVFYRNKDSNGNPVLLYGDDVQTNPHIVRKAQVDALPPTDEWARFEMWFEGGDADPQVLAQLGYSMTLVFSSSKDGAMFEGAVGSTLYVDEVEVFFEEADQTE